MATKSMNKQSISFLLGAGFSIPMGYPIAGDLNKKLLNLQGESLNFNPIGQLMEIRQAGNVPLSGFPTPHDKRFEQCIQLIDKYRVNFDYEEFFDIIKEKEAEGTYSDMEYVYQQVVANLIQDKDGHCWYEGDSLPSTYFQKYDGFLSALNDWSMQGDVYVHTLNHDLLFEGLGKTVKLTGRISDGFTITDSCYYGTIKEGKEKKEVPLKYYTGKYDTNIRLYKLHGSVDQVFFKEEEDGMLYPKVCLKLVKGVGLETLLKKRDGIIEQADWTNFCPNFLTGKKSKERQYGESILYDNLFRAFKKNLSSSNRLIIIGYGFKDEGINNIIYNNFKYALGQIYIVDPVPSKQVKEFAARVNAKLIAKSVENVAESMFDCC
ncbi:MAG: SIR2 family protein [Bacteroides sp.]|nr:SIR2 family protein [Bacteroides sp.]MCM1086023.1 SIR2 family protein [Bacteroides sp.]